MKPDNWTQQLRDKLADYELPPPDDLWADIEAALPQLPAAPEATVPAGSPAGPAAPIPTPAPARARRIPLRRWLVAASVVGLLFGGAYLWWSSRPAPDTLSITPSSPLAEEKPQTPPLTPPLEERGTAAPEQSSFVSATPNPALSTEPTTPEATVPADSSAGPAVDTLAQPHPDAPRRHLDDTPLPLPDPTPAASPRSHPSLALYAMNAFGDQNTANGLQLGGPLAQQYQNTYMYSYGSAARLDEPLWLSGYEERQHHHRPLAYGLTLAYPLSPRLSVTTGIVYTKLRSDFTQVMRTQQIYREQTLHYLGLPLGLSYRLWSRNRLNTYASAALKADWNVSTHLVTEGATQQLPKDRLQWSVATSLGIQYDLLPQLALYLESALNYYPDNHSPIQNYFKDKPLNLNFQLGLRITPTRK